MHTKRIITFCQTIRAPDCLAFYLHGLSEGRIPNRFLYRSLNLNRPSAIRYKFKEFSTEFTVIRHTLAFHEFKQLILVLYVHMTVNFHFQKSFFSSNYASLALKQNRKVRHLEKMNLSPNHLMPIFFVIFITSSEMHKLFFNLPRGL